MMTVLCTIDEKKYYVKIDEDCVTFENDVESIKFSRNDRIADVLKTIKGE